MMSRHFGLNSELTGAIAKRLPHAKNQPSAPGSFFNQFVTDIYIYIYNHRVLIVRIRNTRIKQLSLYLYYYTSVLATIYVYIKFVNVEFIQSAENPVYFIKSIQTSIFWTK